MGRSGLKSSIIRSPVSVSVIPVTVPISIGCSLSLDAPPRRPKPRRRKAFKADKHPPPPTTGQAKNPTRFKAQSRSASSKISPLGECGKIAPETGWRDRGKGHPAKPTRHNRLQDPGHKAPLPRDASIRIAPGGLAPKQSPGH